MITVLIVGSLIASSTVFALIMFAPKSEIDQAIEEAMKFKANSLLTKLEKK